MLSISLADLLTDIVRVPLGKDCSITGLTLDSRQVKPGYLFIATSGNHDDGRNYISTAIENGAGAIICESRGCEKFYLSSNTPSFTVNNLRQHISHLAARFYHYPSKQLRIVGITGTNGKTSCSHYIAKTLDQTSEPCAVIGTLGYGLINELRPAGLTTPDAITIQKLLTEFASQGANTVVMEASSHALDQGRVKNIEFDIGIFTNLTHDHLDYHKTMKCYGASKARLFNEFNLNHAIVNISDPFGYRIFSQLPHCVQGISFAIDNPKADIFATNVKVTWSGVSAILKTPWGEGLLQSQLIGKFNVFNLLATIATLNLLGMSFNESLIKIKALQGIPGHMQIIKYPGKPIVIIDYAHTPVALSNILQNLKLMNSGKIWCVFGCGGDRDKLKRGHMGKIAEQFADKLVLTNDNPRYEDPNVIIEAILKGISKLSCVEVILNRGQAIYFAIEHASMNDIVVIAGKGHETYQSIGDEKLPFCDLEFVNNTLGMQSSNLRR